MGQQRWAGSSPLSRNEYSGTHQYFSHSMSRRSSSCMAVRRRNRRDFYDDDDDDEEDYYRENNNNNFEDEEQLGGTDYDDDYYSSSSSSYYDFDDEEEPKPANVRSNEEHYYNDGATTRNTEERRGGYYQVSFNNKEVDPSETEIDWEICYNDDDKSTPQALVLLPPAAVDRPKAIVHFVGGTVFGSNPKLWYSGLLEAIVRNTSVAVVVTPIPVTLFQNPLEHVRLAKSLQRSFRLAWTKVLEDEYGPTTLEGIPVCGMGHSLGARLLAVMTTMDKNEAYPIRSSSQRRSDPDNEMLNRVIPPYKSLCLISFTNYGAKVGIPGVAALLKQSKKREAYNNKAPQSSGVKTTRRSRSSAKPNRRKYDYYAASGYDEYHDEYDDGYDDYDDYENIDEEWAELVEDFQETITEQANRLQTALTPKTKDLEFFPTPEKLWKALGEEDRYAVNHTLIVQFDDDPIDQGSKLAGLLTETSAVRFARLRGNHLTPVSATTTLEDDDKKIARSSSRSKASINSIFEKTFKGTTKNKRDKIAHRNLRMSLVSYITDVVIK